MHLYTCFTPTMGRAIYVFTLAFIVLFIIIIVLPYDIGRTDVARSGGFLSKTQKLSPTTEVHRLSLTTEALKCQPESPATNSTINAKNRNIFYNVIGKCGSRTLMRTISSVAKRNHFAVKHPTDASHPHPDSKVVIREMKMIANFKPRTIYYRHLHYADFQKHGFQPPIYINMVRDPIVRFASHYNFHKYGDVGIVKWKKIEPKYQGDINDCVKEKGEYCTDTMIVYYISNYFCGFDPVCTNYTSNERLLLAKKHIDENYFFIGLTEEYDKTVMLLEKMIPEYFNGLAEAYKKNGKDVTNKSKSISKDVLSEEVILKLREILADDYEIYEYAKAKYERLKKKYGIS